MGTIVALSTLQLLWYLVVGLSMIFYTLLDGFDLGVGILLPFTKKDQERRIFLNSIGPVWDGNEVWLVIIIGALFAGFPPVYAATLSGFYDLVMILLAALMLRASAIEFRSKKTSLKWRFFWDYTFCLSSLILAFLYGVGLANFVQGLPIDENFEVVSEALPNFFSLYSTSLGLFAVGVFTLHGIAYLLMKTENPLQKTLKKWLPFIVSFFLFTYLLATLLTFLKAPFMFAPFQKDPILLFIPFLSLVSIFQIVWQSYKGREGITFLFSLLCIFSLLILFGLGTFPNLMPSTLSAKNHLTIYNASSSAYTLKVLLIIVSLGIPLVLGYGFLVYRIFRGKVRFDSSGY